MIDMQKVSFSADVSLDAFARRAAQLAERIFDQQGEILPFWIVVRSDNTAGIIVTPTATDADKERLAEYMRDTFRELDVVRYAHIAECWCSTVPIEDAREALAGKIEFLRPSLDPNRMEAITFHCEDSAGSLAGIREIIRPQGRKPYLGKIRSHPQRRRPVREPAAPDATALRRPQ